MSDVHAAVGSYVVHALDRADRQAFRTHLTTCQTCQTEVTELSETAAELGWLVKSPAPAAMRRSVLSHVNEVRPHPPSAGWSQPPATSMQSGGIHPGSRPTRRRPRATSLVLAAAFLAVTALGGAVVTLDQQRRHAAVATQAQRRLLTAPDATVHTRRLSSGANVSFVVSQSRDQALFLADDLPALADDRAYQLWSVTAQGQAPSTVFTASGDVGIWLMPGVRTGSGLALTVEPSGGSPQPTSQPLVTEMF